MSNEYDISRAFKRIENDLIDSMMRNMKRHQVEEADLGFEWEQWQALQLQELERFRAENAQLFGDGFQEINEKIDDMFWATYRDAQSAEEHRLMDRIKKGDFTPPIDKGSFFTLNEGKLQALLMATKADFERAEYAMLRRANDQYRQIIFDSMTYANVTNDYKKAVDMATKDFLRSGINCIEYKNKSKHTVPDYARMALRTGNKRAYLMGEGNAHDRYGLHTVRVNKRPHACPKCVGFLGRLLIDDVYGGGTRAEATAMGIPTLSDAIGAGFLHPNCKDMYSVYIPEVSKPATPWTQEEISDIVGEYNQEQEIRHAEDMRDTYQRMAKYSLDPENQATYQQRADNWQARVDELQDTPVVPIAPPTPPTGFVSQIQFADGIKQEELIKRLDSEYINHTTQVLHGAHQAGGTANLGGAIRISNSDEATAIHEFAHQIASAYRTKVGLGREQDAEFWKDLKKIHRKYLRETEGDPSRWISTYEHGTRDVSEFMAEAFAQQKMLEYGIPLPSKYGKDTTYSKQVLELIDKHYKRPNIATEAVKEVTETVAEAPKVRAFVPAKTIAEAEQYAQRFTDTNRFGALGISYDGVSVDVANAVNKTIGEFFDTYDVEPFGGIIAPKGNTKLGKQMTDATAGYMPVRHSFLLNRKSLKDIKTAEKRLLEERNVIKDVLANPDKYDLTKMSAIAQRVIKNSAVSGRSTIPMTVEEVLWHELGHALERGVAKTPYFDAVKANMAQYAPNLSGYAMENLSEYIAESFCSYKKGEGIIDPELAKAFEAVRRQ